VAVNVTLSSSTTIQNLVFNATNSLENVYLTITNSSSSFIYVYIVNTETGCSSSCELAIPSNGNLGNSATWLSDSSGCFLSYSSS
jgi:hypothetical protein